MCNCNNPATKATKVDTLCDKALGKVMSGYFNFVDPNFQQMVQFISLKFSR